MLIFKVPTQFDRLLERFQAHLAGFACLDMCFDVLAGNGIQLPIDILGETFE